MAISKQQIFEIADELDAKGQNPTLAAVRKALGSGSFTTISEAMNDWRSQKNAQTAQIREPAPQTITDKLAELGVDVWAVALDMANNRLAAEREALEVARAEMEAARQEAAELADQLTAELDEAKARIATLDAGAAASRQEAEELRLKLVAASERAATAEARAGELRKELDRAHREVDQARDGLLEQQKVAQTVAGELEKAHTALATVQATADAEREAHQEQRKTAAAEAHRQAERLTASQAERDAARREVSQAREEAAALRGRLEALESVLAEAKAKTGGSTKK